MKKFLFILIFFTAQVTLCTCGSFQNSFSSTSLLTDSQIDIPVPDFLTPDQQNIYLNAYALYNNLFYISNLTETPNSSSSKIQDGFVYSEIQGNIADYTTFSSLTRSLFTEQCWSDINKNKYGLEIYIEENNKTYAALDTIKNLAYYYNENFCDEFKLIDKNESSVNFLIIGHYSEHPFDITNQDFEAKKLSGYDYTLELPLRMILTENGWKFDKFASSLVDEDKFDYRPYSFHYINSLYLQKAPFPIQIDVQSQKEAANLYQVIVSVSDSSGNPFCSFIDNFSTYDFNPETTDIGYLISDVNGDGNDDILIDLGVAEPYRFFNCYIYDTNRMNFTKVDSFSSIPDPRIISNDGIILSHWKDGPVIYGADKYQIVGSDLQLLSRLTKSYAYDNGEHPRYTEEKMIDGRLMIIKENVLGDEINDLFSYHLNE
ncbi:MAG: hypothetical protein NC548_61425 [Lachnospiraceae bacterium]|nr:hypothetical protein [Lachnospiraceae bacterium]